MAKIEEQVLTVTKKILELLGFEADVKVNSQKDSILVNIATNFEGLVIGRQGQNLKALERVLQVIFYKQLESKKTILVDVGGFREKRTKLIEDIAQAAIEEVLETKQPKTLKGLSPAERKTVHLKVSQNPNLVSESQGQGVNRVLIITPKEKHFPK